MRASEVIRYALCDKLPPAVPPSYRNITSAKFVGKGQSRHAVGTLVMFDGLPATVKVWSGGGMILSSFSSLPGGSYSWNGDKWVRASGIENKEPQLGLF